VSRARFAGALAAIALVAFAIRVAFVIGVAPEVPRIGDAAAYRLLAENLADGRGYIRPFDHALLGLQRPTAEYPPLFPALLSLPARAGADSARSFGLFLAVVGTGAVVAIGVLGRRGGGNLAGIIAAALASCYPMFFISEGIVMSESLYVPLVALSLLLVYRAIDEPTPANFLFLGAVLGLATLTRAEGLLLALALVVPLAWRATRLTASQRLARAGFALGATLLVVAPWTIRNAVRLDAFVPVSSNGATLVDGANCDRVYGGAELGLWRETFSEFGDDARLQPQRVACFEGFDIAAPDFDEASAARKHRSDGVAYARSHWSSLPKVGAVRVLRTWGLYSPRQQIEFESLEGRPRSWQWAGTIMYWVMLPFAAIGAVLLVRRRTPVWPLLATAVVVVLTSAAAYGQQRFRVAAEPAIVVLAAVAISAGVGGVGRRVVQATGTR
jgi:4-amino-4-deoxy-L-arabinose transferase-like glycosyltransferase